MNKLQLLIAGIQGMLTRHGQRIAMVPKFHLPTKEEVEAHARANPPFKRPKKHRANKARRQADK